MTRSGPAIPTGPPHVPPHIRNLHDREPSPVQSRHRSRRTPRRARTRRRQHPDRTAETITGPTPPPGGYTPVTITLRALLDALTEQAVTYDLHAGPGLSAVADALGVSERTVRTRYGGGPRELPLLIALDED